MGKNGVEAGNKGDAEPKTHRWLRDRGSKEEIGVTTHNHKGLDRRYSIMRMLDFLKNKNIMGMCFVLIPVVGYGTASDCPQQLTNDLLCALARV